MEERTMNVKILNYCIVLCIEKFAEYDGKEFKIHEYR